jgi:prepilin-type processing-associated H-X9-DG protein
MQHVWYRMFVFGSVSLIGLAGCGSSKQETSGPESSPHAANADASPAAASGKPLEVSYVTPDFFAALVIHPQRIVKSPLVAPLLKDEMVAGQIRRLGIEPAEIEEAMVLMPVPTKNKPSGKGESPCFVVRFAHAVDAKSLLAKLQGMVTEGEAAGLGETTCAGKKCYQFASAPWCIAHVPDDRTILLGTDLNMTKILSAGEASGPLAGRLRQADADTDAIFAMALESVRDYVNDGTKESKRGAPPAMVPFLDIPRMLKGATFMLDLTGDTLLTVVLEANDAPAAAKVEQLVKDGQNMGGEQLASMRKEMPPATKQAVAPIFDLGSQVLSGLSVTQSKSEVKITVKRPAGMAEAVPKLAAMMMESYQQADQVGQSVRELNNMRQIGIALLNYVASHRAFPPAAICDKEGKPLLSWRVAILPYIGQEALYRKLKLDEPWDSPHNIGALKHMPEIYQSSKPRADGKTSVLLFTGKGTAFAEEKGPAMADIKDGMSNTILSVQAGPDKAVPWTKPEDLPFNPEDPAAALGQVPPTGFHALFFDGHVARIGKSVDAKTLKAMITPDGREAVGRPARGGG